MLSSLVKGCFWTGIETKTWFEDAVIPEIECFKNMHQTVHLITLLIEISVWFHCTPTISK